MTTTYPYWDSANRYIVAGPSGRGQTVLAQIFQLPNSWWQVRCFGSRTNCPEKLGPFFGPLASAQAAIQAHCQIVHYVAQTGQAVLPTPPEILSINPDFGPKNTAFTLTVNGWNFTAASTIYFDGSQVGATSVVNTTTLSCSITAIQVPAARLYPVQVIDSVSGSSNTFYFDATPTAAAFGSKPSSHSQRSAPTDPTTPSKIIPRF